MDNYWAPTTFQLLLLPVKKSSNKKHIEFQTIPSYWGWWGGKTQMINMQTDQETSNFSDIKNCYDKGMEKACSWVLRRGQESKTKGTVSCKPSSTVRSRVGKLSNSGMNRRVLFLPYLLQEAAKHGSRSYELCRPSCFLLYWRTDTVLHPKKRCAKNKD